MDDSTRWSISWMLELALLWFLYCTMPCLRDTYSRPNLAYDQIQNMCTRKEALALQGNIGALQCRRMCMNVCMYVSGPLHLGLGAAAVCEGGAGLGGRVEDLLLQNGREAPQLRQARLGLAAQLGLRAVPQSLSG